MKLTFKKSADLRLKSGFAALFVAKDRLEDRWVIELKRLFGSLVDELMGSSEFGAEEDAFLILRSSTGPRRVALIGLGAGPDNETCRRAAARAVRAALSSGVKELTFCVPIHLEIPMEHMVAALVEGAALANYQHELYKTDSKRKRRISELIMVTPSALSKPVQRFAVDALIVCEAVNFARDLANAPSNHMTPEELSVQAAAMCRRHKIRCRILHRKPLRAQGFGGILSVAQGSSKEPRFIIMEYRAPRIRNKKPIVLVGKGVTFDSGGISIKPAADMDRMKFDMSGGAFVIGAMQAIAALRLPLHVVGLVPAAENLLGSEAYRPGDIIRMYSGKTVEILNTDAEGRLLLADALTYAQRFKPEAVIDLATLTGHCVVALGSQAAGLFTTSPLLRDRLIKASAQTNERIWELPLYKEHEQMMKSHVADLKNSGGRPAGASTAAAFLKEFVGKYPWVHLDIAGTAYTDEETAYTAKASSTGFGIRLIVEALRNW